MIPPISKEVIMLIAQKAARSFGDDSNDRVFYSSNFASVASDILGVPLLDGIVVKMILTGRPGIKQLSGDCWQIER